MPTPKTSLIIPAYFANQELVDMTRLCLDSLRYGRPDEVIVVQDGNAPEPLSMFWPDNVRVVALPRNRGYCVATNTGLRMATGDILIVGNNDLTFTPGWLEGILQPLERGYDIGMIRVSDYDGYEVDDTLFTEDDKFGSLFAMTRKTYETLGGFDESFRDYFSDLDMRRRALNAGLRIGKNHGALVEHAAKATYRIVDPDDKRYEAGYYHYVAKWPNAPTNAQGDLE